jgi:hypothetical protein
VFGQYEAMCVEIELVPERAAIAYRHAVLLVVAGVDLYAGRDETPVDMRAGRKVTDFDFNGPALFDIIHSNLS